MAVEPFGKWHTIRAEPGADRQRTIPPLEGVPVELGQVTSPSGTILVVDMSFGLLEFGIEAVEPAQDAPMIQSIVQTSEGAASVHSGVVEAIVLGGVPTDARLSVYGVRMGPEHCEDFYWQWVFLDVRPGAAIACSEYLGSIMTDYSLLMFGDVLAVRAWHHFESIDGMADLSFWGGDVQHFAQEIGAPPYDDRGFGTFGWKDLPSDQAKERALELTRLASQHAFGIRVADWQHTHSYLMEKQIASSESHSGTLQVGGALACGFSTGTYGTNFAVVRDLDSLGQLVRVRVCPDPYDDEQSTAGVHGRDAEDLDA